MITEFSKIMGVTESDLLGASRKSPLKDYRHVYWWLLNHMGFSCVRIARMNNRTNTTVSQAIRLVNSLIQQNDSIIVAIFEKVQPLLDKIKDEKTMNVLKQIIELTTPTNANAKNSVMSGAINDCSVCNGAGYLYTGGYMVKYKKDLSDPDYIHCAVCGGTGKVKATVTVDWAGVGEVVELPKE